MNDNDHWISFEYLIEQTNVKKNFRKVDREREIFFPVILLIINVLFKFDCFDDENDLPRISHAKNTIHIQAEQSLCIQLTKTNIDLLERLITVFMDAWWNMDVAISDDDNDDESILSLENLTGYPIRLNQLVALQVNRCLIGIQSNVLFDV